MKERTMKIVSIYHTNSSLQSSCHYFEKLLPKISLSAVTKKVLDGTVSDKFVVAYLL
jgi:hypothetical protein